jgi:23S rRNA pseudouridine1911/1915/1917 synthase
MIESKTIHNERGGVRLDAALLDAFPSSTRAFIREAIAAGEVLVNGRAALKGQKLHGGEELLVKSLAEARDNVVQPNPEIRLNTVFEDAALLAFDKPAALPVQPLSRTELTTLMNGVVARYPECAALGDRPLMAGALHRIDADTSGLVLVARTAEAFENLRAQFAAQTVEKTYLALVEGAYSVGGTLENDLIHDPTLPFCRMIDAHHNRLTAGAIKGVKSIFHAVTRFVPIGHTTVENEERTLLEVTIFTGVTHQIRAQLALAGIHIVNDRLYGAFAVEGMEGHCLHALGAKFVHPMTGQTMDIRTSYPAWARL